MIGGERVTVVSVIQEFEEVNKQNEGTNVNMWCILERHVHITCYESDKLAKSVINLRIEIQTSSSSITASIFIIHS